MLLEVNRDQKSQVLAVVSCTAILFVFVASAPATERAFQGTVLLPAAKCFFDAQGSCGIPNEDCVEAGGRCLILGGNCVCSMPAP